MVTRRGYLLQQSELDRAPTSGSRCWLNKASAAPAVLNECRDPVKYTTSIAGVLEAELDIPLSAAVLSTSYRR